ncbi:dynamin family protein [Kitasatospora sp. NPDC056184]|uniref:dynamin family protein n=1 Tax=Kitasatospora sp. NPDC056184 TaxID=3345738 RepID=UPI0035E03306
MFSTDGDDFEARVLDLVSRLVEQSVRGGDRAVLERLDRVEGLLRRSSTTAVVLGEFNSGKSSLLNALLEEVPGLFPVDSFVATRALTSAEWGEEETVTVSLSARTGRPAEERRIDRSELRAHLSEAEVQDGTAAIDADRVSRVSVRTPNPKLRGGVVLVDTPGIGGVHRGHTAVALGVLPQADLALYVTDAGRAPLPSELAFVERVARAVDARNCPERLLFAVTKIEDEDDPDASLAELQTRLAALPGVGPHSAILPVSSRRRLLQLAGDEDADAPTGFGPFEDRLWADIARTGLRTGAGAALVELDLAVQSLRAPVDDALAALAAHDAAARAELAAAAAARAAEAELLAEGAAEWPEQLRTALDAVTAGLRTRAGSELAELWRAVRSGYRTDEAWLAEPQLVVDELAARLALLTGALGRSAAEQSAAACHRIAERAGLRVSGPALAGLPVPPLPDPSVITGGAPTTLDGLVLAFDASVRGARLGAEKGAQVGAVAWDQALSLALAGGNRTVTVVNGVIKAVSGPGATRERSVGAVTGSVVGGVVGAVLAFTWRVREIRALARTERIAALDQLLDPWEAQQRAYLETAIHELVAACAVDAEAELRSRIKQRQAECRATAATVAAAAGAAEQDATASAAELTALRDTLDGLAREVADLGAGLRARLAGPSSDDGAPTGR